MGSNGLVDIDSHSEGFPPDILAVHQQLRTTVHDTVSGVGETNNYEMPTAELLRTAHHVDHIVDGTTIEQPVLRLARTPGDPAQGSRYPMLAPMATSWGGGVARSVHDGSG
jgi:hypothetical protein